MHSYPLKGFLDGNIHNEMLRYLAKMETNCVVFHVFVLEFVFPLELIK